MLRRLSLSLSCFFQCFSHQKFTLGSLLAWGKIASLTNSTILTSNASSCCWSSSVWFGDALDDGKRNSSNVPAKSAQRHSCAIKRNCVMDITPYICTRKSENRGGEIKGGGEEKERKKNYYWFTRKFKMSSSYNEYYFCVTFYSLISAVTWEVRINTH